MDYNRIKAKVKLQLPLTAKERSIYILFIATLQEAADYLAAEKQ